jgi:nucleoside phosphorylase
VGKSPSLKAVKMLFATSGGLCAFPGCTVRLVERQSGAMLGEMCHINAASTGGPRYSPGQHNAERNEIDNLIILCPTHHSLVDQDPTTYTAEALRQMKVQHEIRVATVLDNASSKIDSRQVVDFARQVAPESVDFAIVVALEKELLALRRYFPDLKPVVPRSGSSQTYYWGRAVSSLRSGCRVVAVRLPSIDNVEAAQATADMIADWSPRFIIVNGLAAGLSRAHQHFGDIVVADSITYCEPVKARATGIGRRTRSFLSDRTLINRALNLSDAAWTRRLPRRPDGKKATVGRPGIHVGAIASGDEIIASGKEALRFLSIQRKLIAVEMESTGVASTAFSALKKIGFLTVGAICDFADGQKDDSWQDYAAATAAAYLRAFIVSRPVAPSEGRWPNTAAGFGPPLSEDSIHRRKRLFEYLCNAVD